MNLNGCLILRAKELKDFDKQGVIDAAQVYQTRGREEDEANALAIEDHIRELERERDRVLGDTLEAWKAADPKGYEKALASPAPKKRKKVKAEAAAPKKPVTPQVDAPAGSTPLGAAPKKSAISDLGRLFGGDSLPKASASEDFNEFTYLKAQPMFAAAIEEAGVEGGDLKESMRAVVTAIKDEFGLEVVKNMQPYIVRYIRDIRDGKIGDGALPAGWSESSPGGMATNQDPVSGGIVDAEIASGKWFVIPNNDAIQKIEGMASRADALKALEDAINTENGNGSEQRGDGDLERDSQDAETANGVGQEGVRAGSGGNGQPGGSGIQGASGQGRPQRSGSLFGPDAPASGEPGDQSIYTGAGRAGIEAGATGSDDDLGGGDAGFDGPPIESNGADLFGELAESSVSLEQAKAKQRAADKLEHKPGLENIRATLPALLDGQQQDVHTAETRFAKEDGYGMLFTNGTGTGKTFSGLGIVKRMAMAGKGNIIITVPSDKIAKDWIKSAKMLNLDISLLENTKDSGRGIVVTTYANFGQNPTLAKRNWDLVVADEAHRLSMNAKGGDTLSLGTLQALTMHPDGAYARAKMLYAPIYARIAELQALAKSQRMSDDMRQWQAETETQAKLRPLLEDIKAKEAAIRAEVVAAQGAVRTRALFLSATPFAYEKSIEWANGYLFDYSESRGGDGASYNSGNAREQFFMQHFGYRMRYNKLTEPDAKVDRGVMQRQFNTWLKQKGSVAGRMLDVKADYDRRFVLTPSAIGARIDEALEWFEAKRKAGDARPALDELRDKLAEQFTYLERRYLLEAIKAREVIPHIREHLALGRKVVVVHDYKKGGARNPFLMATNPGQSPSAAEFNEVLAEWQAEFKDLIESKVWGAGAAIETIRAAFPNVLLFNGDVPKSQRQSNVEKFQDDASGPQVLLGLSHAMKEGVSLHDTTGKHQRVLINLGQPTAPVDSIQIEGRIYRTGQITDAIIRYLNTGTDWEKWAFATTIAQRASAAENLGMGELARALKDSFIAGFEESDDYRAGMENEGKGGKERDKAANAALTEYDRARAFYFGTQKKTAKTKAAEGTDYYATPEPVGLKMMELADIRPGESVLEPSAGHGAIARWAPETSERTAIEPSMALRSRLAMVFDGTMLDINFEDLHINNKFDAIVLNPPFGTAGRTAIDHVIKAATHLRDGGRIVALIPRGSADAKFDKWFYEKSQRPAKPMGNTQRVGEYYVGDTVTLDGRTGNYRIVGTTSAGVEFAPVNGGQNELWRSHYIESVKPGPRIEHFNAAEGLNLVADINLPAVTFERAGTKVSTRIVVLEKSDNAPQQTSRDYSNIEDINELFDRMENLSIAGRAKPLDSIDAGAIKPAKTNIKEAIAQANAAAKEADAQAQAAGAIAASNADATFELKGDKIVTNAPARQYTTNSGKVLDGVIVPDQTMAKAVDRFTWKIKGENGYFVRLRHIERPAGKVESTAAPYGPTQNTRAFAVEVQQRLGLKQFDVWDSGADIHLSGLIVSKSERKQGSGTAAMNELIAYADAVNKRITLSVGQPDDHHGTTSRARLVRFYKRFGFIENKGRNKDFVISAGMFRNPERPAAKLESTAASYGTKAVDVESAEFKAWFRGSKVVSEGGKPLTVYHGTIRWEKEDGTQLGDIETFDRMASVNIVRRPHSIDTVGSWFSTNPSKDGGAGMYGDTLYPVYLSIKNPHETTFQLMTRRARLLANGKDDGRRIGNAEVEAYRKWLADMGKDGIRVRHDNRPDSTEFAKQDAWIALEPDQIKSAISNSGAFSGPRMIEETAYHGSPYLHSGFDSSKIGTGEGAQAYGWGHYFAGAKAVAEHYRKTLSKYHIVKDFRAELPDDGDFSEVMALVGTGHFNKYQERVLKALEANDWLGFDYPAQAISAAFTELDNFDPSKELRNAIKDAGHLYTVDLKPKEDEYLLWDKPLDAQSATVRNALEGAKNQQRKTVAEMSREELQKVLQYVDPNGSYSDAELEAEGDVPLTIEELRESAANLDVDAYLAENMLDEKGATGESFYRQLSTKMATAVDDMVGGGWSVAQNTVNDQLANDKAASKYLLSIGIRGIKYKDGNSRFVGASDWKVKTPSGLWHRFGSKQAADDYIKGREGYEITEPAANYNYVIFDDADIEIASVAERAAPEYGDTYDLFETRPGTTDKQRDEGRAALDAIEQAERRIFGPTGGVRGTQAAVLGSAISRDFREDGGTSFVGKRVTTTGDLAMLGQAVRDPRFETFRIFYTDKSGKILGQGVYSSRLPGVVYLPEGFDAHVAADMASFRASGYWMMHNHPSGRVEASRSDEALTADIASKVPGFAGHVILDHNEYGVVEVTDYYGEGKRGRSYAVSASELASKDLRSNPEVPHAMLGEQIGSPEALALAGKKLQVDPNVAVLIGVDANNKITLIVEVADWALNANAYGSTAAKRMRALAVVRRAARETGLSRIFAVVPGKLSQYFEATRLDFLTDVVDIDGKSAAAQGDMNSSGALPVTKANKSGLKARTNDEPVIDVKQTITSAKTSRKIVPATIRWGFQNDLWVEGNINFDIGSGKFDDMAQAMTELEIENLSYDPFWHSPSDNREAIAKATPAGADTVTVNNVLNVIKEPEARGQVIRQAAKALKPSGTALFLIYEGDKTGVGAESRDGYQTNAKAAEFISELEEYFGDVTRSGAILIAKKPIKRKTAGLWTPAEGQPAFSTTAGYGASAPDVAEIYASNFVANPMAMRFMFDTKDGTSLPFSEIPTPIQREIVRQVGGEVLDGEMVTIRQRNGDRVDVEVPQPEGENILEASRAPYGAARNNAFATVPPPPPRQAPAGLRGGAPGNNTVWTQMPDTQFDGLIRTLSDRHIDTKRAVQAIQAAGRQVADKWDPYLQETLFHGRVAKRTLAFIETELTPLAKDLAMRGLTMDELDEYLHARHAKEANALIEQRNPGANVDAVTGQPKGSGMTDQGADDYFAALDPSKQRRLAASAQLVDAMIDRTRRTIVAYGLESQDTIDGWFSTFDFYVPLMREEKNGSGFMGIGQGFSIKGKETKMRTGSTRAVVDILANIALQRERAITRGEKNRVSMSLFGLAKLNPNSAFWTTDKIPMIVGLNPATGLVEAHPDPNYKNRENVVVAKFPDGKGKIVERAVIFNEDNEQAMNAAMAMKNLDIDQLAGALGSMAKITRYFAAVNTQWNPVFGVTNFVRDIQEATLNLSSTPIAGHKLEVLSGTFGALAGIYSDTRKMRKGAPASSSWAREWEEFQREGGQTGYREMWRTSEDRAKEIRRAINPHEWMDSKLGQIFTAGGVLKVPFEVAQAKAGWLFDWLSDYNESMENAVRLSAYKVGKAQGMSRQRAAEMAKSLTVNFNRKGRVSQHAGMLYAFFNASVQGTARSAQNLFDMQGNDIKTARLSKAGMMIVGGGILVGSMQALMLAALGFDDDEPPEFVRERNVILPVKLLTLGAVDTKKYHTIPMPLGYRVLPNIGRIATEFAMGGFKDPAKHVIRLMGIVADAFNPVGGNATIAQIISPTASDPLVALGENKDWTKKPIAKEAHDKTTPGHKLWKDTASTPAKVIAEAINWMAGGTKHTRGEFSPTPDQIDYLVGQVTGGVGRELSKLEQSITATVRGEDLPPHKIPLVGRFYGDAASQTGQSSAFYANINRINEYEAEIKGLRKEGKHAEATKFIKENPESRLVMRANYSERRVQELRKEKHDLVEKGAPRAKIKVVEERIKGEMTRFNDLIRRSKEKAAA